MKFLQTCRRTIVRRIYSYIQDELKEEVQKTMFLSLMADESTDTSDSELILYLRYIDIEREEIVTFCWYS